MTQRATACLASVAVLAFLLAAPCAAADVPDITGRYKCEGASPGGQAYRGTVEISKKGDTYALKWAFGPGETYQGVGILEGNVLAVSYSGTGFTGVVVYKVEKGPKLVGRWAFAGGKGTVQTETLTK